MRFSPVCGLVLWVSMAVALDSASTGVRAASPASFHGVSNVGLVVEPTDGSRPIVRDIDHAQKQVFVAAYILTDRPVVDALERAASERVAVYVMLDPHPLGLGTQPVDMANLLRAAGVHVRWSRPGFTFSHDKYIVLDDRTVLISTANFSRSAFTSNREFIVVDRRPADVYSASALFRADWDRTRVSLSDADLVVAPQGARGQIEALLADASRSIDIYAEEIADSRLEAELAGLAHRGVRVRVLIPPSARNAAVSSLVSGGVQVRTSSRPYIHAKAVVVDNREGFVGSENVSATSLDHNRELGILIRGTPLRTIADYFETDWVSARPVT